MDSGTRALALSHIVSRFPYTVSPGFLPRR